MKTEYHDMTLNDIMPSFRCMTTGAGVYVEIPTAYSRFISQELPQELREIIRRTISGLCKEAGRPGKVYNESIDNGHAMQSGFLVEISAWDFACHQRVKNWKAFTSQHQPWKEVKNQ